MQPSLIVIEAGCSFKEFQEAIEKPELPFIDSDAVVGRIVDALSSRQETAGELISLGHTLLCEEFLGARTPGHSLWPGLKPKIDEFYEDPSENLLGLDYIVGLATNIGQKLKQQFEAYRLYQGDVLGYEYHGIIDEHTLVLRSRPGRRSEAN